MEENQEKDVKTPNSNEIKNKDKTFNKLKEIQYLLKKESALNELCKWLKTLYLYYIVIHAKDHSIDNINKQCKEIVIGKLEVMHKINQRLGKDNRKYELYLDDQEILRDLKNYIPNLMNRLWELPKTVVSVIENASKENLKEHLAPLFANNFYENILSSYYIEDNLIYVLYLLLHTEINKLNNFNQIDKFLDETPCGILLGELRRRSDIQSFFKNIIIKAIENLEANNSMNKIYFDLDNMISFYPKTNSRKNEEAYLNDLSGDNDDSDDDDIFGDGVNIDKKKIMINKEILIKNIYHISIKNLY